MKYQQIANFSKIRHNCRNSELEERAEESIPNHDRELKMREQR